jgi:putative CocE/NonD family hydrolase
MGAVGEPDAPGNVWREAVDWPPPAREQSLFLQAEGRLDVAQPEAQGGSTSYVSDPRQPMQIEGRGFPGARDARGFETQAEVRTWTTEPLSEPVEWTGAVQAELWLSSTAPDTDVIVRVSDVYPDGRSLLVMDYPLRARYREGFEKQVPLTPGEPAKLAWRLGWTSLIFNKGHRIRVTVASTGAPLYEPNSQTGGPQTRDWLKDVRAATNTVWHDAARPSRLIVPRPVAP